MSIIKDKLKDNIKKTNKGFTLIELLVTIAISAIVMFGLSLFISNMLRSYKNTLAASKLQIEAAAVSSVFNNVFVSAYAADAVTINGYRLIWVDAKLEAEKGFYIFLLNSAAADGILYYATVPFSACGKLTDEVLEKLLPGNEEELDYSPLAEFVSSMGLSADESLAELNMRFEESGQKLEISSVFAFRNRNAE